MASVELPASPPPSYVDSVRNRHQRSQNEVFQPQAPDPRPDRSVPPSAASALKPRVAVLLGLNRRWYPPLLLARACSTAPAAWWSARCAWVLFWAVMDGFYDATPYNHDWDFEHLKLVTEVALALLWSASAAYLSYFFADCLMSRWLLNYTPPATLVRLLALNAINAYVVSRIIHIANVTEKPSHLLPAWIVIATVLSVLYRVANGSTNIRRETSKAVIVFLLSSFISMCALLALIQTAST